jgi:hypothetical protein
MRKALAMDVALAFRVVLMEARTVANRLLAKATVRHSDGVPLAAGIVLAVVQAEDKFAARF